MLVALVILAVGTVAAATWVRVAPSSVERWHVNPRRAPAPTSPNAVRALPEGGEIDTPVYEASPDVLAQAMHTFALTQPSTTVLAGAPEEQFVTYVQRSDLVGFPDYVSVRTYAGSEPGTSRLGIFSRSRFGYSDLGVNRARVELWLTSVESFARRE